MYVFRVVMVMSYYHGDFGVHIENSMNVTGFILSQWLLSGCGQQSNNSPQGSVSGVFIVHCYTYGLLLLYECYYNSRSSVVQVSNWKVALQQFHSLWWSNWKPFYAPLA